MHDWSVRLRTAVAVAAIGLAISSCSGGERPSFVVEPLSPSSSTAEDSGTETTSLSDDDTSSATSTPRPPIIVIDPGHNGANGSHPEETRQLVDVGNGTKACNTTGAETNDGIAEAQINWEISLLIRDRLEREGWTVILTRPSNDGWGPCIDQRAAIGNDAGADAVVSIHADGGPPDGAGFHVIVPAVLAGLTDDIATEAQRLGTEIRNALVDAGFRPADYVADNGLVARSDLGGLNLSDVPVVFAELGNLRNDADARLLTSTAGQQRVADAVLAALETFLAGE